MRLLLTLAMAGLWFAPHALRAEPPEAPVPKGWDPGVYRGWVVAITDKTVTLKLTGVVRLERISFNPDGTVKLKQVYVQDNNQPPKVLVFGDQLLPRPGGRTFAQHGHNISDLQVGDVVQTSGCRWLGVDYCNEIAIYRRPAGRVPPAVGDERLSELGRQVGKNLDHHRWDHGANAAQEREERAVQVLSRTFLRFHP